MIDREYRRRLKARRKWLLGKYDDVRRRMRATRSRDSKIKFMNSSHLYHKAVNELDGLVAELDLWKNAK